MSNPVSRFFGELGRRAGIALFAISGGFSGASRGRRMGSWGTADIGPKTESYMGVEDMRNRSRELARNHSQTDAALDTYTANAISTGIIPRWDLEDEGLQKELQDLWGLSMAEMDWDENSSFSGLQALAQRELSESGEVLGRVMFNKNQGLLVPVQLQLLECDHLDVKPDEDIGKNRYIRRGIEFYNGKRTAYHLSLEHPGESLGGTGLDFETLRIPANYIFHIFRPLRAGAIRGRPWISPSIVETHEFDIFEDAALKRMQVSALLSIFIRPNIDSGGINLPGEAITSTTETDTQTGQAKTYASLSPGTVNYLDPGEEVTETHPPEVGNNYEAYIKHRERILAKGHRLTYEQYTGDLSMANYAASRAGLQEFRRLCEMLRQITIVHQLCRPWIKVWLDQVVLNRVVRIPDYWDNYRKYTAVKWSAPGWPWVNPLQDVQAEKIAIRSGIESLTNVREARGNNSEELDLQIERERKRTQDKDIKFDSNPNQTNNAGGNPSPSSGGGGR